MGRDCACAKRQSRAAQPARAADAALRPKIAAILTADLMPTAMSTYRGGASEAQAVRPPGQSSRQPIVRAGRCGSGDRSGARGFDAAPRAQGRDRSERGVLSYLPGQTGPASLQGIESDDVLAAIARLTRRYHDAVADFVAPADAAWQFTVGAPRAGDVICHNDIAPWNIVFEGERQLALIDWDFAAPAPRLGYRLCAVALRAALRRRGVRRRVCASVPNQAVLRHIRPDRSARAAGHDRAARASAARYAGGVGPGGRARVRGNAARRPCRRDSQRYCVPAREPGGA